MKLSVFSLSTCCVLLAVACCLAGCNNDTPQPAKAQAAPAPTFATQNEQNDKQQDCPPLYRRFDGSCAFTEWRNWDPQKATDEALSMLQKNAVLQDGALYVAFDATPVQQQQPQWGFAQPLTPRPAAPFASHGIMRITTYPPKADLGTVNIRIRQFSVFADGSWTDPRLVTIHYWQWKSASPDSALTSLTDQQYGTDDGGVTEFVAAVLGVPVSNVRCGRPNSIG